MKTHILSGKTYTGEKCEGRTAVVMLDRESGSAHWVVTPQGVKVRVRGRSSEHAGKQSRAYSLGIAHI